MSVKWIAWESDVSLGMAYNEDDEELASNTLLHVHGDGVTGCPSA